MGETGDRAAVSGRDVAATRLNLFARSQPVTCRFDFDRDGDVDSMDLLIVRRNVGRALPQPPAPAPMPAAAPLLRSDSGPSAFERLEQEDA